ncbi:hypothetical protein [Maribacter arcticus]|uniref:Uncharacterized protein n=1 Tax=Maribacter arcticus TaxID=561365 RepID=A0A1T5AGW3_9FLAO|nr:hypothetical protein [Maribacter arcticus]SKB34079.1 hypothetical protein SAMN05660866_00941 [Maribacter arcticus]|tara:strand:+ start:233 stop:844 length:612 start_codon:yes stop_codon:yes gene_type:complete
MKELTQRSATGKMLAVLVVMCILGCGASQTHYQREYAKVWKELIKSQAWQESLRANNTENTEALYASNDNEVLLANDAKIEAGFEDRYQALVSKAYFKIITEAEKADARISADYKLLQDDELSISISKKQEHEITKKYEAHKAMLSGLKSWNIFSEDRSGDLDYFKIENEGAILRMIQSGDADHQMVNYLIYKLADLYHVEEN